MIGRLGLCRFNIREVRNEYYILKARKDYYYSIYETTPLPTPLRLEKRKNRIEGKEELLFLLQLRVPAIDQFPFLQLPTLIPKRVLYLSDLDMICEGPKESAYCL